MVSRRGQYGTIVVKTSQKEALMPKPEMTIFAPAAQAAVYRYEKIKNYLKQMITHEFDLGEKLPSMQELAKKADVSTNTIKKALHDLSKEGYSVKDIARIAEPEAKEVLDSWQFIAAIKERL